MRQTRHRRTALSILTLGLVMGSIQIANAQEQDPESRPVRATEFLVVGAARIPEYEGAGDQRTVPFVVSRFYIEDREVEIDGLEARFNLVRDSIWRAGPALSVTIPRGDDASSEAVASLPSIDAAVELGAYVGFRMPFSRATEGTLSGYVFARRDVTGQHDGWLVKTDIEYFFAAARALRFGFALNATYASNSYADTYFSVSDRDAPISGLPVYDARGGLKDVGAEAFSVVSFSEQSGVFLRATYNRLLNDFADSPIVALEGDENQWFYGIGYFRRF